MENYLKKMSIDRAKIIAKFKLRSNHLPCSSFYLRGHVDLEYDCPICLDDNPDESHYLISCPYFNDERSRWLPDVSNILDTNDKVKFIFENCRYSNFSKFAKAVMDELAHKTYLDQ